MARRSLYGITIVVAGIVLGAAISASCTYGVYDGSALVDGGSGVGITTIDFRPGTPARGATRASTLVVQVPADAFASATTIRIEQLPDRTIANSSGPDCLVPVFRISAEGAPLTGRLGLEMHGNTGSCGGGGGGPGSGRTLAVGIDPANGTRFVPTPIGGNHTDGVWGVATSLGDVTIISAESRTVSGGGPSATGIACLDKCCQSSGNVGATGQSCRCDINTGGGMSFVDLGCFIGCTTLAEDALRCDAVASTPLNGGQCPSPNAQGPGTCGQNQVCCVNGATPNQPCVSVGSPACTGFSVRCRSPGDCQSGRYCCAGERETLCLADCPIPQRVCEPGGAAACGSTSCQAAGRCPFATCGPPPTLCK